MALAIGGAIMGGLGLGSKIMGGAGNVFRIGKKLLGIGHTARAGLKGVSKAVDMASGMASASSLLDKGTDLISKYGKAKEKIKEVRSNPMGALQNTSQFQQVRQQVQQPFQQVRQQVQQVQQQVQQPFQQVQQQVQQYGNPIQRVRKQAVKLRNDAGDVLSSSQIGNLTKNEYDKLYSAQVSPLRFV